MAAMTSIVGRWTNIVADDDNHVAHVVVIAKEDDTERRETNDDATMTDDVGEITTEDGTPRRRRRRRRRRRKRDGDARTLKYERMLHPQATTHPPNDVNDIEDEDEDGEGGGREMMVGCGPFSKIRYFDNARRSMGTFVNDGRVQAAMLFLILVNAIMMGVATFPIVKYDARLMNIFEWAYLILLVLFTIESAMQLLYHGYKIYEDGFLLFDLIIVIMSWSLEGSQVVRAFRILGALRLITRIRVMRQLILALFSVVPKMSAIFMLLMLIFYIFSVMFTQLFKGMYDLGRLDMPYFETLYDSAFTLFQMMTMVSAIFCPRDPCGDTCTTDKATRCILFLVLLRPV